MDKWPSSECVCVHVQCPSLNHWNIINMYEHKLLKSKKFMNGISAPKIKSNMLMITTCMYKA